ncbi:MAG: hypothetical protein H6R18_130 [Proteobacteria bacterium]|nr:hypothetical protein [Pseudomonadota bacterium]
MFGVNRSYVSGFGLWMKEEFVRHPEWQAGQQESRALWWDGKQDRKAQARLAAAEIRQQPYTYDVNF